ncbi:MAG TPA: hypothetical protein VG388_00125 [Solirubrobacteraceae bacterium]|nr:hypothetical protein [Solirubrobacteraceae bacterium]
MEPAACGAVGRLPPPGVSSLSTLALLVEEGVKDPEEYFSRLVSEFAVAPSARGARASGEREARTRRLARRAPGRIRRGSRPQQAAR